MTNREKRELAAQERARKAALAEANKKVIRRPVGGTGSRTLNKVAAKHASMAKPTRLEGKGPASGMAKGIEVNPRQSANVRFRQETRGMRPEQLQLYTQGKQMDMRVDAQNRIDRNRIQARQEVLGRNMSTMGGQTRLDDGSRLGRNTQADGTNIIEPNNTIEPIANQRVFNDRSFYDQNGIAVNAKSGAFGAEKYIGGGEYESIDGVTGATQNVYRQKTMRDDFRGKLQTELEKLKAEYDRIPSSGEYGASEIPVAQQQLLDKASEMKRMYEGNDYKTFDAYVNSDGVEEPTEQDTRKAAMIEAMNAGLPYKEVEKIDDVDIINTMTQNALKTKQDEQGTAVEQQAPSAADKWNAMDPWDQIEKKSKMIKTIAESLPPKILEDGTSIPDLKTARQQVDSMIKDWSATSAPVSPAVLRNASGVAPALNVLEQWSQERKQEQQPQIQQGVSPVEEPNVVNEQRNAPTEMFPVAESVGNWQPKPKLSVAQPEPKRYATHAELAEQGREGWAKIKKERAVEDRQRKREVRDREMAKVLNRIKKNRRKEVKRATKERATFNTELKELEAKIKNAEKKYNENSSYFNSSLVSQLKKRKDYLKAAIARHDKTIGESFENRKTVKPTDKVLTPEEALEILNNG